jgi:hypothetical protein
MSDLVDLQTALRLLTSVSSSQSSDKTSAGAGQTSSNASSTSNSAESISGILDQARSSALGSGQLLSLQIPGVSASADAGADQAPAAPQGSASMSWSMQAGDGQVSGEQQMTDMPSATASVLTTQNNLWVSENSMTSQQLTDAIYSGGLAELNGSDLSDESFVDALNGDAAAYGLMLANATAAQNWATQAMSAGISSDPAAGSNETVEQYLTTANSVVAEAQQNLTNLNQVMSAYENHTLDVQNAVDVQGLDYTSSMKETTQDGSSTESGSTTWNQSFLTNNPDGQQHVMIELGNAELYLSW